MKTISLLALALCAALPAPSFAATFSNNWSFVDLNSGQTVSGTISGLSNGDDQSAEGLTITVTQSPYAEFLGTYEVDFGAGAGLPSSYSAVNGVVTFANFLYTNEITEFLQFGSHPGAGSRYPAFTSYASSAYAYNDKVGMTFSAVSVPEPASWALMIGGFALTGSAMRRRKATISFA